ncbi:SEC-C metal-binding domain-containing protein [Candidatus Binatus sp.]|uniref:SEC-C metal-binding domain-containing protein n=1 Tax=Candidatus Binatus sp. TaxID=2811406 RepID=UPI003C721234
MHRRAVSCITSGRTVRIRTQRVSVRKETRSCEKTHKTSSTAFEVTSKRRKGFASETRVKRGRRFVHGDKELTEKLGRNDLCPCGSGRCFQAMLPQQRPLRRIHPRLLHQRMKRRRGIA